MLILSRRANERIELRIGDEVVTIEVVKIRSNDIRLGFTADPAKVQIIRSELIAADARKALSEQS